MERIIFLGTGNAVVTQCYNTCFVISSGEEYFLVDGGGGNGILLQLQKANVPLNAIRHVFISHAHTDHIFGIVWIFRIIGTEILKDKYSGNLDIYCHEELVDILVNMVKFTLPAKLVNLIGKRIIMHPVTDGESKEVLGNPVQFFDIGSDKVKQFGFSMLLKNGKKLAFVGDEPYTEREYGYVNQADWLLHEAFCLYSQHEQFNPYEKHHSTVKEACETAEKLGIRNLVLYHTEDRNIVRRKKLYMEEGKVFYSGNLFVPDDLEVLDL